MVQLNNETSKFIGAKIIVKGNVLFSSLSRKTTNKYDTTTGNEERYRLKVENPIIVKSSIEGAESIIRNKIYDGKEENQDKTYLDFSTRAQYAPAVFDKDGKQYNLEELEKEIKKGEPVLMSLELFKPQKYNNVGVGLLAVQITSADALGNVGGASFEDAFDF